MKIRYILFLLVIVLGFSSCDDNKKEENDTATRTMLVYMVASDLGSYLQSNIDQMISVANKKNLNGGHLIVYYSSYDKNAKTFNGELFEIKEGNGGVVTRHHIRDYNGQSAVDPQVMRNIVNDAFSLYPADSYGILLSSHATAWLPSDHRNMLRSFGEENGIRMEIYDLASALKGLSLDFIAVDACSMGAIECAYELKDCADYYISSTAEIMGTGFPFKEMLPYFFTKVPDYENITRSFYNYYLEYAHPYGNLSVVKTAGLAELATVSKEILASAGGIEGMYNLNLKDHQVLSYIPGSPTKLYDFTDIMLALATSENQKSKLTAAMDNTVVSKYATEIVYCGGFSGNSRFVPVKTFSGLTVYPFQQNLQTLSNWYQSNLSWYKTVF